MPHEEINHKDHSIFDHRNQRFTANWILPNLYGIEFIFSSLGESSFEKFTMKSFALPFRVSTRRVGISHAFNFIMDKFPGLVGRMKSAFLLPLLAMVLFNFCQATTIQMSIPSTNNVGVTQTLEAGYYKIAYVSGWFDRFGFGQNYMVRVVVTFDGQSTTYLSTPEYNSVSTLQAYADGSEDHFLLNATTDVQFSFGNDGNYADNQGTVVLDLSRNMDPTDLNSTAVLTIAENQPVGTIVGEFNATDPEGNAITYHLVSGEGDGNNSLFTLDANGSLSTAVVFDYEANAPTYSIRVQAKDEYNATLEGNFTVLLRDAFELNQSTYAAHSAADLEMIWVEPGTFTMGSPTSEAGRGSDENETQVTLTQGFYLGKYEVTQAQYEAVMTDNNASLSPTPSNWPGNPNRPVEQVSWDDIQIFLERLNEQEADNLPPGWAYVPAHRSPVGICLPCWDHHCVFLGG